MTRALLTLTLALFAMPLTAQDWLTRPGDSVLAPAEIEAFRGQTLTFYDDGKSVFFDDGRYTYTYAAPDGADGDGGTGYGYWKAEADGVICIEFVTGFSRCDRYVRNAGRLILQTESGERFPIRP